MFLSEHVLRGSRRPIIGEPTRCKQQGTHESGLQLSFIGQRLWFSVSVSRRDFARLGQWRRDGVLAILPRLTEALFVS